MINIAQSRNDRKIPVGYICGNMLSISVKNLFEKPFAVEEIFHKRRAFFM